MVQLSVAELRRLLQQGVVEVIFTKKDGSKRTMLASLSSSALASAPAVKGTGVAQPENPIRVIDTEINQWRSIDIETVISYRKV